jgi:hypothetical protein
MKRNFLEREHKISRLEDDFEILFSVINGNVKIVIFRCRPAGSKATEDLDKKNYYLFFTSIRSLPTYWRRISGIKTDPSACW